MKKVEERNEKLLNQQFTEIPADQEVLDEVTQTVAETTEETVQGSPEIDE